MFSSYINVTAVNRNCHTELSSRSTIKLVAALLVPGPRASINEYFAHDPALTGRSMDGRTRIYATVTSQRSRRSEGGRLLYGFYPGVGSRSIFPPDSPAGNTFTAPPARRVVVHRVRVPPGFPGTPSFTEMGEKRRTGFLRKEMTS